MSIRKLRAELKDLCSKMEQQRRSVVVPVVRGETKERAPERLGIVPDDSAVDLSFIDLYPEGLTRNPIRINHTIVPTSYAAQAPRIVKRSEALLAAEFQTTPV